MGAYEIFTISSGNVSKGACVQRLSLKGAGIDIPAILIGEIGRGRERGVLPIQLLPEPYKVWEEKGEVIANFAQIGTTKAGKPKLFQIAHRDSDEKFIGVFRTDFGFRGSNNHTGERIGWTCGNYSCEETGTDIVVPEKCPKCGATGSFNGPGLRFDDFPGELLSQGGIAQGAAGRMGGGTQLIAILPKNIVFRTSYSGRLYGGSPSHYYLWDGEKLIAVTWDERIASDVF